MDNQEVQQFEEQEIDLLEVFHVLWRKVWVLILALVVGISATGVGTYFLITPQYTATSIIYILSKTTSITSLADLQIGSQMAADFQIIATTREVLEPVRQQYDVEHVYEDYEDFVDNVEVTNPTNSHMSCCISACRALVPGSLVIPWSLKYLVAALDSLNSRSCTWAYSALALAVFSALYSCRTFFVSQ